MNLSNLIARLKQIFSGTRQDHTPQKLPPVQKKLSAIAAQRGERVRIERSAKFGRRPK